MKFFSHLWQLNKFVHFLNISITTYWYLFNFDLIFVNVSFCPVTGRHSYSRLEKTHRPQREHYYILTWNPAKAAIWGLHYSFKFSSFSGFSASLFGVPFSWRRCTCRIIRELAVEQSVEISTNHGIGSTHAFFLSFFARSSTCSTNIIIIISNETCHT